MLRDVCPGLTATVHDIAFLDDSDVEVDIGASLTCCVQTFKAIRALARKDFDYPKGRRLVVSYWRS